MGLSLVSSISVSMDFAINEGFLSSEGADANLMGSLARGKSKRSGRKRRRKGFSGSLLTD
jgi:hypothetical protein